MACLFCKIIEGLIESDIVYEDDDVLAFRDINAQAPTHVLIIPRQHISTINDINTDTATLLGKMTLAAKIIAKQEGIHKSGYRLAMNCNDDGGQTVFHLHMHLLGGRSLQWPPG